MAHSQADNMQPLFVDHGICMWANEAGPACVQSVIHIHMYAHTHPHRTHMQDLKETTDKVHYENFRHQQLQQSQSQGYIGESNI